jgi:hypothetical protein
MGVVVRMAVFGGASSFTYSLPCCHQSGTNLVCVFRLLAHTVDWLFSVHVGFSRVDTSVQQKLDHSEVAVVDGVEQWSIFIVVDTVQIAAGLDQKFDNILASINCSNLQRRISSVVGNIQVLWPLHKTRFGTLVVSFGASAG